MPRSTEEGVMNLELVLNPKAKGYDDLQRDLKSEFGEGQIKYSEAKEPAPPDVLSAEYDVVKFVFEHPVEVVALATAAMELVRSIIDKRKIPIEKDNPPSVIVWGDRSLPLPSAPKREAAFLRGMKKRNEGDSIKKTKRQKKKKPKKKSKQKHRPKGASRA
jgi:hypothetical protein